MRNYVIINGVNSLTIQGLAINNLPPITKPMIRTQREEIDGRDGDIVTELGYSAYDKQMEIGLYGNFDIDAIIKYFTGEGTIVFSNEADKYYNFKILDQIDYEKLLKFKTAVVTFHCQPFKYPLEEEPVEAEITTITGTGENITLEDIEEAPMKIVYKGNTYQYSTSGKNLIDYSMVDVNYTQLYDTGYYKLSFPGNKKILEGAFKENTQYTLSFMGYRPGQDGNGGGFNIVYTDGTQDMIRTNTTNPSSYSITSKANKNISYIFVTWGSTNISYLKDLQLEEGSQATSYEPYTNGASPNPSYPQDIHTVSGDNEITICGKNLIDTIEYNRGINSSGVISGVDTHYLGINDFVPCKPNTTYSITFEHDISTLSLYIGYKDQNGNFLNRTSSSSRTFTTPNNAYYLFAYVYKDDRFSNAGGYVQLEYGTQTPYEPYQSQSYELDLGKNLFNDTIRQGVTTYDGGVYSYNATRLTSTEWTILPAGTYTINIKSNANDLRVSCITFDTNDNFYNISGVSGQWKTLPFTFTAPINIKWKCNICFNDNRTIKNSDIYDIQLEKGSEATTYAPYKEPIELCKIGTYQDKIDKSTGKNLLQFDNENNPSRSLYTYTTERPERITCTKNTTGNDFYAQYIAYLEEGKTYTLSVDDDTNRNIYMYSDRLWGTAISGLTNKNAKYGTPFTFTSPYTGIAYIGFFGGGTQTLTMPMLNEGTTALPYEPYGTSWYLKKEIGKVVLNGTEDWRLYSASIPSVRRFGVRLITFKDNTTGFSNYFLVENNKGTNETQNVLFLQNDGYYLGITDQINTWNDTNALKTFLSNNNTIVYYVLATPTYTLIEGELLNQLEAIKMSYEGQTNISQTNNDLPLELDASVTFLTPMEINNIGNIYAKPILTIEGTGNIGVVLNDIQILDIDLSNNGKIAIDVPKLEAYNPDDDSLLNRLVTGDYMKLLINEGDNKITFTGEVSGATLTNYIRWI